MPVEQACVACCDAGADFDWCRVCGRGENPCGKYDPNFLRRTAERNAEIEARYGSVPDTVVMDEIMKMLPKTDRKTILTLKNIARAHLEKENPDE